MTIKEIEKKCNNEVWAKFCGHLKREYRDTPESFVEWYTDARDFLIDKIIPIKTVTLETEKHLYRLIDDFMYDYNTRKKKKLLTTRL